MFAKIELPVFSFRLPVPPENTNLYLKTALAAIQVGILAEKVDNTLSTIKFDVPVLNIDISLFASMLVACIFTNLYGVNLFKEIIVNKRCIDLDLLFRNTMIYTAGLFISLRATFYLLN